MEAERDPYRQEKKNAGVVNNILLGNKWTENILKSKVSVTKLWFKVASKQSWHQALEFKWVCWGKRVQTIKVWQKLHKWKPLMLHLLWWKTQPKIILTPTTFGLWPLTDSKTKERKKRKKNMTWNGRVCTCSTYSCFSHTLTGRLFSHLSLHG